MVESHQHHDDAAQEVDRSNTAADAGCGYTAEFSRPMLLTGRTVRRDKSEVTLMTSSLCRSGSATLTLWARRSTAAD